MPSQKKDRVSVLQPRLLLDTHILIRWFFESRRLTRTHSRTLEAAVRRGEPVAISAITLLEIAAISRGEQRRLRLPLSEFFQELNSHPALHVLPLSFDVALESASLTILRDPADRAIVASARVHRLRLLTSDQRIIDSRLVDVIE